MTTSSSPLVSSPREGKRSFSSTIKSFFISSNRKRPSSKKFFESDSPRTNQLGESDVGNTLHVKKRKRMSGTSQHNDRFVQNNNSSPIIIYGTESTERPPVLPILPIQRLRLLREKQKLSNIRELKFLQSSRSPSISSSVILDSQAKIGEKGSYLRTSSTPSPVKKGPYTGQLTREGAENTTIKLPVLRSLKNRANREKFPNQSKGTVWSADFEYDLSEYEAMQENNRKNDKFDATNGHTAVADNKNIMNNDINGNLVMNPKMASETEDLGSNINSNRLSTSQRNLLLNGFTSTTTKRPAATKNSVSTIESLGTPTLKKIRETKKDKETIVLPTIGFDFIKDNETPSKKTSPTTNSTTDSTIKSTTTTVDNDKPTKPVKTPALSFNFGQKANESKVTENVAPSPTLFKFGGKSDTISSVNKSFSFGKTLGKDEKSAKSQGLTLSFSKPEDVPDKAVKSTAPAFSFGKHKGNDEQAGDDDGEPRRKRRVPVSEDTNAKPLFSFGNVDNQGKAKDGDTGKATSEKPSFVFGPAIKQAENGSSFRLNKKVNETDKTETTKAFTFGKPATIKGLQPSASETSNLAPQNPTFTFGQSAPKDETSEASTKPAFSFGKLTEDQNNSSASNEKAKPSFSDKPVDVQASADDSTSKPAFSFTRPSQGDSSGVSESKKPSFTFGASSSSSQQKPLFSFGKPDTVKEPSDSKSSFSFTKPSIEKANNSTTAPSFTFGGQAATDTNTKPSFDFEASESIKPSTATVAGNNEKISGGFSFSKFGDKKEKSATPTSFFNGSASTTPVSVIGKPTDSTNNTTTKSAFSFGNSNTKATDAAPNSISFSLNAPNPRSGTMNTTTTTNSTSGTNIVGGFNLGKPAQNIAVNSTASAAVSGFSFTKPESAANSITANQSSFNFGSNGVAGLNPFTSTTPSDNTGPNKPASMGTQNTSVPSTFNFTGNNSAPGSGSVFNTNNNISANTVFGGSNTTLSQQSQNASFKTNGSFTPSTVPNINFAGFNGGIVNSAAGTLKPSDIFGGNSTSGLNVSAMNPSSVFGGPGGVASFGQSQPISNQMGMGVNNGMGMGMNMNGSGNGVMTNRKIARMRHSKR